MTPLAKQIIDKISQEEDSNVLAEVLDFYDYLKGKKRRQEKSIWNNIVEEEADPEEVKAINNYLNSNEDTISLDDLANNLGLNE